MTKTLLTKAQHVAMLKHLAGGKSPAVVSAIFQVTDHQVIEFAKNHGYPDGQKMAWAADILEKKLEQEDQPQERPLATGTTIPGPRSEAVSSPPARSTLPPVARPDEIRILINTAKAHPSKRIRTACDRLLAQIDRLDELIAEDDAKNAAKRAQQAAKAEAREEVERLKVQLAAAQAKLRGPAKAMTAKPKAEETAAEPSTGDFACRAGCDQAFGTPQGRSLHERRVHPEAQAAS